MLLGECFTVYEDNEGWAWGQSSHDDYVGYVAAAELGNEAPTPTHRVSRLRTFVYPLADLKAPPLAALSMNAKLCVSAEDERFSRAQIGATPGYIFSGHLSAIQDTQKDFVAVTLEFVGAPYLWGGRQSGGLDCSALVQLALESCGVAAPRDADLQEAALGEFLPDPTDLGALRRGDLVFWKGHVGIMVDAQQMVHANMTHMAVTVDPLAPFAEAVHDIVGPITSIKRFMPSD